MTPEHKRKISIALTGRTKSLEERANISRGRQGCTSSIKMSVDEIKDRIRKVHGDKYDLKLIKNQYDAKIVLICPIHGRFTKSKPDVIYAKTGCTKCNGGVALSFKEVKARVKRNLPPHFSVDWNFTYVNIRSTASVLCKKHGHFSVSLITLISNKTGKGCKGCSREIRTRRLVERGNAVDRTDLTRFDNYRREVRRLSSKEWKRYNPSRVRTLGLHLDHIFSVMEGYLNEVPPEVISNITNLRLISSKRNRRKTSKSHKTLSRLYSDYAVHLKYLTKAKAYEFIFSSH